ncbi:MAG: hypothetical protein HC842_05070 [Cytophagales bacterium]|nr:hypothetical protein [Cytophagales bacterium]
MENPIGKLIPLLLACSLGSPLAAQELTEVVLFFENAPGQVQERYTILDKDSSRIHGEYIKYHLNGALATARHL